MLVAALAHARCGNARMEIHFMLVVKTGSNAALLYKTAAIEAIEVARVAAFKNGCGNRAAYLSIRAVVARVDLNDDISDFRYGSRRCP